MKRKGFTIVELMGVMVLIAIVLLLGISGVNGVSKRVKEKSHENLIQYIETKAAEYANETGNLITNVDELVKKGYIEADDNEGHVKSPKDGSILNCHIVNIKEETNNLYGEYTESEECNVEEITKKNLHVGIHAYKTRDNVTKGEKIEEKSWVNTNVILEAYVGEKIKKEEIKRIKWKSNATEEEGKYEEKQTYLVTAEQIVNTKYRVEIELEDKTSYESEIEVKIDKQRPIVYSVEVEREEEYTNYEKKIEVNASDGNGSGIYGYYIGNNPKCNEVSYERNENNRYETRKGAGTYYVCVRDKAGNVAEDVSSQKIEIKNVDTTPPVCVYEGESANWTSEDRTISLRCEDEGSGCVQNNSITKTYNWNIKTEYWSYTIKDKAGNETICNKEVNVYVDKDRPEIRVKESELSMGDGEYDFKENVSVRWGYSGEGRIECNPASSLKTGIYEVTCSAISKNGLSSSTSFMVKHSYPATLVAQTCVNIEYGWIEYEDCSYCCEWPDCPEGSCPCTNCCQGYCFGDCQMKKKWGEISIPYDCPYYTCPNGGNLNELNNICYY